MQARSLRALPVLVIFILCLNAQQAHGQAFGEFSLIETRQTVTTTQQASLISRLFSPLGNAEVSQVEAQILRNAVNNPALNQFQRQSAQNILQRAGSPPQVPGQVTITPQGLNIPPGGTTNTALPPSSPFPTAPVQPLLGRVVEGLRNAKRFVFEPLGITFIDPATDPGFDYMVESGPSFTSVLLPTGYGDNQFELYLPLGNSFSSTATLLVGGVEFSFPAPAERFRITGIEGGLENFVTGLRFDGTDTVSMLQIGINGAEISPVPVPVPVPEPHTVYLLLTGIGLLAGMTAYSKSKAAEPRR